MAYFERGVMIITFHSGDYILTSFGEERNIHQVLQTVLWGSIATLIITIKTELKVGKPGSHRWHAAELGFKCKLSKS